MARCWLVRSVPFVPFLLATSCGGTPRGGSSAERHPSAGSSSQAPESAKHKSPLAIQIGHAADVYIAAFSPDGALVATGDRTGTIELWDPATGEVHAELAGHTANVTSLAFSRDGKRLVSGGEDGRVFVWDLTRGARLSVVEIPDHKVWGVALSPDGETVVARDNIGLSLHRADTGQEVRNYDHSNAPGAVISPDGAAVVIGSGTNLQIVEIVTGKIRAELKLSSPPRQVVFSNDGRTVFVAGGESHKIGMYDATSGALRREVATSGRVVAIAIDDKATLVAAAVESKGVEVFDAQTGTPISTIAAKRVSEWHFGMTGDGKRVFASDESSTIQSFDTRTGQSMARMELAGLRRFVVESGRGRVVAMRDRDPTVDVWDGKKTTSLAGAPEHVRWAGLFPDGKSLAIVEDDSPDILIVSLATDRLTATLHSSLRSIYEALPSFDGERIFATGYGEGEILDALRGRELKRFSSDRWSAQYEAAWSPSGEVAFVGLDDHNLYRYGPKLEALAPIDIGSPAPTALAYSPDGKTLAAAGQAGVMLFRDPTYQKVPLGDTQSQPAYGLAWAKDGDRIAIASELSAFVVATTAGKASADGQPAPIGLHTELDSAHAFVATAFSPDGTRIAATERSGVIDVFGEGHVEKAFHTHGTPWSVSFLPKSASPVIVVAATSLGLVRLKDGAVVRIRTFDAGGKRVALLSGLGGVAGDPEALARVRMRSSPDVRAKLLGVDAGTVRQGLALELAE